MQEFIEIRRARENNLKDVSLRIPKRKITIFTGVSGSGKSSIVFDTIATEAQRLLNENFSMFIRGFLPQYSQPEADAIENLPMSIIIDQKRLGGGARSTVGTITDIYSALRLLYSRIGQPHVGSSYVFSFNDPTGMCKTCNGIGKATTIKMDALLDTSKSLNEGAILSPIFAVDSFYWEIFVRSGLFDPDKKIKDYTPEELDVFLNGKAKKIKMKTSMGTSNLSYEGLITKFTRLYISRDVTTLSESTQKVVAQFTEMALCPTCEGKRLNEKALSSLVGGKSIADASDMEADELLGFIKSIDDPAVAPLVADLTARLQHLVDIGLDYLSLNRETDSLSGGESQRIKMVKNLSGSLSDVLYIFDEPSVGLHPRDVHRLNELLQKLRDKGNTVLVVEHDPDVIKIADHIVDVGPKAGKDGGQIMFEGTFDELIKTDTLTGKHMNTPLPLNISPRTPTGVMPIAPTSKNNLKNVSVTIPTGVLTVVTGVAGSGKSSLINQSFVGQYPEAIVVDQSAVAANSRSNPATYIGIMDAIRKQFATANKVSPSLFSYNSKGACEDCQGTGVIHTDLGPLDSVKTECETCGGKRFKQEVLQYKVHDKSIVDVLAMPIEQAKDFFGSKDIVTILEALCDVGVGYLTLGQPLNTLSGGECQRVKLAQQLHKKGSVYVMDEPTTGLHFSDIGLLIQIINRLVDNGNTVIAIEHNLDIIRSADWIVDIGPEGGHKGGEVVFEGTPEALRSAKNSITAQYI